MIALLLNSGLGSRMGDETREHPKCMCRLTEQETIISWQVKLLRRIGVTEAVVTTGHLADTLIAYLESLDSGIRFHFVHNPKYRETNYIYSMYLARNLLRGQDVISLHGDLVLHPAVMDALAASGRSAMAVDSTLPLPDKDFKALIQDGRIRRVGVDCFDAGSVECQAAYHWQPADFARWMDEIERFVERGDVKCYAENAFNAVSGEIPLYPLECGGRLCAEIDNQATVGLLTDEVVASYKHYPLIPLEERIAMFEGLKYVSRVVVQESLDYTDILNRLRPDIVVHGDDWLVGYQANIRQKVIETLKGWGGELVEFPYTHTATEETLSTLDQLLSLPETRRSRLRRLLHYKPCLSVMEAHDGLTGLIVEKTTVETPKGRRQFDAIWVSSLCDSTAKGKPDIELVDMTSRLNTLEEIMEVTTKPIILDGDTGGLVEHFVYNVQTLERTGISAVIIEDKQGLKKNSLFGTGAGQKQASIPDFCEKITAGKNAQKTKDFMIIARCESLILEQGLDDALTRCHAYVKAGADGIMIHSKAKTPDEVFAFCDAFRKDDPKTPLVVVPTTYNMTTEDELAAHGVNIVIHANHLIRSAFPAMQKTAQVILEHGRSHEADPYCMSIKEILTLLPNR